MNNEKKVAIVVGGGQTLGAFLSEGLADAGYRVVVADLNGENAQKWQPTLMPNKAKEMRLGCKSMRLMNQALKH